MKKKFDHWIGVDLDGTLAFHDEWLGPEHIGEPIPKMVEKIKAWLKEGKTVKIVTARVSPEEENRELSRKIIMAWTKNLFGIELEVTCEKNYGMRELWDDRAYNVERNTGELAPNIPEDVLEVLRYYGSEDTYRERPAGYNLISSIEIDTGMRARKILEKYKRKDNF